ncbi:protein AAR2 isoform X1 [Gracilaria domingensis]|nr:protein AAR2 isoform X1 [Gracilaria domingensis]
MVTDVHREDLQWFSQLSDMELESHLQARGSLYLNPAQRDFCIDSRCFSGPLRIVHGIAPNLVHVAAIQTASPAAPAAVFFQVPPTTALRLSVDSDSEKLHIRVADKILSPLGTRGVAALSLLAEHQWESITSYVTEESLRAAGLSFGTTVYGSENVEQNDCSPHFTALPPLKPRRDMSAAEVTEFHLDRREYVTALVKSRFDNEVNMMLGEMQLAFVCFHILGCLRSLEHWTCLLREICNSTKLDAVFPDFYKQTAIALEAQIRFLEEATIQLAIRDELRQAFACFACAGRDTKEVQKFTKTVNQLMGWSLTGDEDEGDDSDGPVIVNIA